MGSSRVVNGVVHCRRSVRIAVAAGALVALATVAGCGKGGGSGASSTALAGGGGAPSTGNTVKAIQDKLNADPALKGAKITALDQGGTIQLDGTVQTDDQKSHAEDVVYGVQTQMNQQTGVQDNLMVGSGASTESGGGTSSGK